MMNYLNLSEEKLKPTILQLNGLLGDLHIHYQNLRQSHWAISGPLFFGLHEAYEKDYAAVSIHIDDVAERIRSLNHQPQGKLSEYLKSAQVKEVAYSANPFVQMRALLADKKILIKDLRAVIETAQDAEDEGTIDLAGSILGATEKQAWMYQAWINEQESIHNALHNAMQESDN